MINAPSTENGVERKNWLHHAIKWVSEKRTQMRDRFESSKNKRDRILGDLDRKRHLGGGDTFCNPYNDPDALVETAERLLAIGNVGEHSAKECLMIALRNDPDHEGAKKLMKELG